MMKFRHLKPLIEQVIATQGLNRVNVYPGPDIPDYPGMNVVLSRYGGPGLELEGLYDQRAWQVRVIGDQGEYDAAEDLADNIDIALIGHLPGNIGPDRVLSIQRVGGSPSVLMYDDAERVHFVCSYVGSVQLALPN